MLHMPTQAYLINGPFHGNIIMLDRTSPHPPAEYRIAKPPQMQQWTKGDPWEPSLKTGIYKLSSPLRYDPINHNLIRGTDLISFFYEWVGWES